MKWCGRSCGSNPTRYRLGATMGVNMSGAVSYGFRSIYARSTMTVGVTQLVSEWPAHDRWPRLESGLTRSKIRCDSPDSSRGHRSEGERFPVSISSRVTLTIVGHGFSGVRRTHCPPAPAAAGRRAGGLSAFERERLLR